MGKTSKKAGKAKGGGKSGTKDRGANKGAKAIGKAEKKLERALRQLDDARAELSAREAALRDLLIMQGRMPVDSSAGESDEPSTAAALDQSRSSRPIDGLDERDPTTGEGVVGVPFLDQRQVQVLEPGSGEPDEREGQVNEKAP
ncbi:MAG TPA: hypothetical protein VMM78_05065 [Thermomicrobiales bacterium]|nr:hypothetical protein [Thermomicrobiales bacterium]